MVIIGKLLNGFWAFVILTIFCMTLTYIARIKWNLENVIDENINLFDRMHEGLVLVSEKERNLMFASRPAVELLS